MIGVKNNGEETFVARYDGVDYKFEPGVTVTIDEAAATHIFGFGLEDKQRVLVRHGWLTHAHALPDAMKKLATFQFLAAKVQYEETPKIERSASSALASPANARMGVATGGEL